MPRRHATRAALGALALALVPVLSGCDRSEPVRARGGEIVVRLTEYAVAPQKIVSFAGRVRLTVRNEGILNHNLNIKRKRLPIATLDTLRPGESGVLTVDEPLPAGSYTIYCSVNRHEDLGQYGTLVVRR